MKLITAFILLVASAPVSAQQSNDTLDLLFVGDVMQHGGQIEGAYNAKKDSYDYRDCFQFVKPVISKADIAIANLEVTHAGKPYKGYPQFSAPPELSEGLVDAGFDVIITANNHSCDGGAKGVTRTLDVLDQLGVKHTGTFRSKAEREKNYPLIIEQEGMKVAILNYTYGTNGLSVAAPLIINYIDSAVMKADFKKAKTLGADLIICTVHWGEEYKSLPNGYQKHWEAFCYSQGADMVIGSHPHVLQPVEVKTVAGEQKLTAWSLGNFISNQRDRYKDGGMMLTASVTKTNGKTALHNVGHYFTWVYPRPESVVKPYYILPDFSYNALRPNFLDDASKAKMDQFFDDSRKLYAEHASGTTEKNVANAEMKSFYELLLGGYYAVEYDLPVGNDWKKLDATQKQAFHKVLGADGAYHLVSGVFDNPTYASGHLDQQRALNYPNGRVVYISPKEYKTVTE